MHPHTLHALAAAWSLDTALHQLDASRLRRMYRSWR